MKKFFTLIELLVVLANTSDTDEFVNSSVT